MHGLQPAVVSSAVQEMVEKAEEEDAASGTITPPTLGYSGLT